MKKLLLLGGSGQQIVAIKTAKNLGYYTILCDYLEDNPGQYYADKFYLISTTDKEAILDVAKKENIDGILAYASDPAAPTAAYVATALHLPTNPYRAVETLCNKDQFRDFLLKEGFAAPQAYGYQLKEEASADIGRYQLPIIIKPVDSSGSKGITVLYDLAGLEKALDFAFSFSRSHRIIIEEFVEKKHRYLIGGDIFVYGGKVIIWGLLNCHRDTEINPLVPVGKSFPPDLADADITRVKDTLQSLVDKLHISFGAMNVELIIDQNNHVIPLDIGPRNGGNMIPDLLSEIFGVDIVELTVKVAMGEKICCNIRMDGAFYATHNLHSDRNGVFSHIEFTPEIENYIIRKEIYKKRGDKVEYFDNASKALGIIFLKFHNFEKMMDMLEEINKHVRVCLECEEDSGDKKRSYTDYKISAVEEKAEKEHILKVCDCAFDIPLYERAGHEKLIDKINANAEFLAAYGSQIMGYAVMYANDHANQTAYITLLAVHPQFQRKHIGYALIEACIKLARSRGMCFLKLEVKCKNKAAISFYKNCGFLETGEYTKESCYLIKKI